MTFRDDIAALALLGRPHAHAGQPLTAFDPGAFTHFAELDHQARQLVLHLLDAPQEQDWQELAKRSDGKSIAQWMLTLPVFSSPG